MSLETLGEATRRLAKAGYRDGFRAEPAGLRALEGDRLFAPEDLRVDEIVRFEGDSDPADEAALFALCTPCGLRGTFVVTYGPSSPALEAEMARRLVTRAETRRPRGQGEKSGSR